MQMRISLVILTIALAVSFSSDVFAWDKDGHGAIGIMAVEQLQPDVRLKLERVIGSVSEQELIKACDWPDAVRNSKEWAWSEPLHYINIQEGQTRYSRTRDCPDQLCNTEAIKQYSDILGSSSPNSEQGWQAFAWLCHLTGDLHQPLHAGFARDRGGNDIEVIFRDEQMDLHEVWDGALIDTRVDGWKDLLDVLGKYPVVDAGNNWSGDMVNDWTEESHQLVLDVVYPSDSVISQAYEDSSWVLIKQRMMTAASRLALIINTVMQTE